MNPLSGSWKKLLFAIAVGVLWLFVSKQSGSSRGAAAAQPQAPAASQVAPEDAPPPSNEIPDFQQLD